MSGAGKDDDSVIAVRVGGIVVDPRSQVPVVILRALDDDTVYLPIFIGGLEATAIATVLADVQLPRPMTHDLMVSLLAHLDARVVRIVVTRLEEGTFYAEITLLDQLDVEIIVDARPSDAIALALRVGAPIYVAKAVMAEAGAVSVEEVEEQEAEAAPDAEDPTAADADVEAGPAVLGEDDDVRLEDLDPEDFGKYKM
ncbi:MAG: bifunctional nuclease family protein [Deltaproteobacteria bacterium]|nr:MAG: bifunctional nuclease family protein [Deltaproteobacteria bacterium]